MRKILFLIILTLTLVSCNQDGSKVKAWSVDSEGGGLSVLPPWGEGNSYFLSSNEYIRADYVGLKQK